MIHVTYTMSGKRHTARFGAAEAAALLSQARNTALFKIVKYKADTPVEAEMVARMMTRVGKAK